MRLHSQVSGFVDPQSVVRGILRNGQEVVIIPLDSGGSGGIFSSLVFTKVNGRRQYAGYLASEHGHVGVSLQTGLMRVSAPVYAPSDRNAVHLGINS